MTPHEVLGVRPGASGVEIKRAYRHRAAETHPDTGGDPEGFRVVTTAYEALTGRRAFPTVPVTVSRKLGYLGLTARWWQRRRDRVRRPRVV